jgi:hypothetical protein
VRVVPSDAVGSYYQSVDDAERPESKEHGSEGDFFDGNPTQVPMVPLMRSSLSVMEKVWSTTLVHGAAAVACDVGEDAMAAACESRGARR